MVTTVITNRIRALAFRALTQILASRHRGMDPVARFTTDFAAYLGVRYGVAVNSGTSALEIAVTGAGVGPGDEVIVPSYSYYSTASAVLKAGARPVFVDVALDTGCIDLDEVCRAVTEKTRAVIVVHVAGVPADLDRLVELCRARRLTLIEDAAQAVGSEWKGRKVGSFGALGCFSFQASKTLSAGEGGFIATDDPQLFAMCSALSNVGILPGDDEEKHVVLGGNYRLSSVQAAILSVLLETVDDPIGRREDNAAALTASLKSIPGITPSTRPVQANRVNYLFYGFRYDRSRFGGMSKDQLIARLHHDGVPCEAGYPTPLYAHPAFQVRQPSSPARPNAITLCHEAVGFDQHFLSRTRAEMERAVHAIRKLSSP